MSPPDSSAPQGWLALEDALLKVHPQAVGPPPPTHTHIYPILACPRPPGQPPVLAKATPPRPCPSLAPSPPRQGPAAQGPVLFTAVGWGRTAAPSGGWVRQGGPLRDHGSRIRWGPTRALVHPGPAPRSPPCPQYRGEGLRRCQRPGLSLGPESGPAAGPLSGQALVTWLRPSGASPCWSGEDLQAPSSCTGGKLLLLAGHKRPWGLGVIRAVCATQLQGVTQQSSLPLPGLGLLSSHALPEGQLWCPSGQGVPPEKGRM